MSYREVICCNVYLHTSKSGNEIDFRNPVFVILYYEITRTETKTHDVETSPDKQDKVLFLELLRDREFFVGSCKYLSSLQFKRSVLK